MKKTKCQVCDRRENQSIKLEFYENMVEGKKICLPCTRDYIIGRQREQLEECDRRILQLETIIKTLTMKRESYVN